MSALDSVVENFVIGYSDFDSGCRLMDAAAIELAQLRAAAAERDRLQVRILELESDLRYMSSDHRLRDYAKLEDTITAQAAQLEQARNAIDAIVSLGKDSHDVGDDVRWREMWHVAVEEVEDRPLANVPAPQAVSAFAALDKLMTEHQEIFANAPQEERTE